MMRFLYLNAKKNEKRDRLLNVQGCKRPEAKDLSLSAYFGFKICY